ITDSLEAFLCYAEAFYNQNEAHKAGYQYAAFLNPEVYFESVYESLKAQPPKLIGMFKYVHATTNKIYYDRKRERCIQLLGEHHVTFFKKLEDDPFGGTEIQVEYDRSVSSVTKDIKFCNKKIYETILLFEAAKEYTGDEDLDIDDSLKARVYAQDQLNSWR
ncbi:10893_t:CDS:1, partial [Dentiscutata erythropus]